MPHGRELRYAPDRPDEKLWNTPVPERAQLIADLAKHLFGRKRTEVSLRVDDRHIQLTITVRGGANGKMARRNHDLFCLLATEALDVDLLGTYPKRGDAIVKLSGTPARAERAELTSTRRRHRRRALAIASYVLCFWSALECYDAYRDARTVWHDANSHARLGALLCMWVGVVFGWAIYHWLVRHTVVGPALRRADASSVFGIRH